MKNTNKSLHETPKLIEVRVAERLAAFRGEQGLTLKQLAMKCGLSDAYLSRVENHKAAVNIANLSNIALALGVPIAVFFEDNISERPISVCRKHEGQKVRLRSEKGLLLEMLAAEKKGKLMEPFIVDLASSKEKLVAKAHPGDEFFYVLVGECTLIYGKDKIHLKAGDSVYYDPSVPHFTTPDGKLGCRVLAVVASRSYLFHGDISRLMQADSP